MKKFMKRLLIIMIFAVLIGIPKINASAEGDIVINETKNDEIYPEYLTGSFFYLISGDTDQSIQYDFKVTATIDGAVYNGTISKDEKGAYNFTVNYPTQKYGTKIDIEISDGSGESYSKTYTMDYYIDYVIDVADKDIKQTEISGTTKSDFNHDKYGILKDETVFTVAAKIGDQTYKGTVSGYNFTVTYPKQKFNTKVTVLITDRCEGHTSKKTFTIANHPPKLTVDKVYYNSTYVSGKTQPNLKITINVSGKQFKGNADSEGKFKIKIPEQKINTKITVGCTSETGYTNSKDIIVTEPDMSAFMIDNDIVKNTTQITGSVEGVIKGDYVTVKIGSKTYKTVLKTAKNQKFKITIKKPEVGQKVTVSLYNNFNQKRFSFNTKVYLATKPSIGMTKKQVLQTTWGSTDYVSTFNIGGVAYEQWAYEIGHKFIYLWFEKGILKSINSYSY